MTVVQQKVLSESELSDIYVCVNKIVDINTGVSPTVLQTQFSVLAADLPSSVLQKIRDMGIAVQEWLPFTIIYGDFAQHVDSSEDGVVFNQTTIFYLTDNEGDFMVEGVSYKLNAGDVISFGYGVEHGTNGSDAANGRLMIGPMNELGERVGALPSDTRYHISMSKIFSNTQSVARQRGRGMGTGTVPQIKTTTRQNGVTPSWVAGPLIRGESRRPTVYVTGKLAMRNKGLGGTPQYH